jgi:hypothetical protein
MTGKSIQIKTMALAGAVALLGATTLVYAADGAKEAAMAARHATLASKADNINIVHKHLHHVVNCLVGPKGEGFDAKEANPCAALGDGAIPDTTDSAMKTTLMDALKSANAGLASDDLAAAQKDASETAATLEKAK